MTFVSGHKWRNNWKHDWLINDLVEQKRQTVSNLHHQKVTTTRTRTTWLNKDFPSGQRRTQTQPITDDTVFKVSRILFSDVLADTNNLATDVTVEIYLSTHTRSNLISVFMNKNNYIYNKKSSEVFTHSNVGTILEQMLNHGQVLWNMRTLKM